MSEERKFPGLIPVLLLIAGSLGVSCAGGPDSNAVALYAAVDAGDAGSVAQIAESVNVNATDGNGRTALHRAVRAGDIEVAGALLNAGADPDIADRDGRTALHYAVLSCDPDLIAMMLGADADMTLVDDDGATAADLAAESDCEDASNIIRSAAADFIAAE